MSLIDIVRNFEGLSNFARFEMVCDYLERFDLGFEVQIYSSGRNVIVNSGSKKEIGVSSHFDAVPGSPGANDNATAVAVTLDILKRFNNDPLKNIGVRGLFFDEEEKGLVGSRAYVRAKGTEGLIGVYNMEMVGLGDKIALWSDDLLSEGLLIKTFECVCKQDMIPCFRFPDIRKILNNSGDHYSFNQAGIKDAFCITTISDEDIKVAAKYLSLPNSNLSLISRQAYSEAPLFSNYHKSSDNAEHLNEKSLKMVSNLIYNSIRKLDSELKI
ncbi:Peptidase family M28 [uncultured archaeon]|nr:Peptidase family M28 [uncultured archaeon]